MADPVIILSAPHDITEKNATFTATIVSTGGKQVHLILYYRRSGKPQWQSVSLGWWDTPPPPLPVTIATKCPNLQHEARLRCSWLSPYPGGDVYTDIIRFWFIPYSPRAKGAPFFVTAFSIDYEFLTLTLKVTTDIPARLKAKISTIAPYSTTEVERKRGRAFKHHPVLVWQWLWQVSQQEPGDTTDHTFVWNAPWGCLVYYFQCWGTTDGKTSPSRSPFFSIHPPYPGYDRVILERWDPGVLPPFPVELVFFEEYTWAPPSPHPFEQVTMELWSA